MVEGKVSKEEIEQIVEEIENDEELETEGENEFSEEELEEMDLEEGEEEEDEEEDDGEFEDEEESSVVKNYTIVKQPVVTEVTAGAETGAKGEVKPFATIKLTRHIEVDGFEFEDVINSISDDFGALSDMVQDEISNLKKKLNKANPEMQ